MDNKMIRNYLLLCLFGISIFFLADTDAHEAIVDGTVVDQYLFPLVRYQVSVQINHVHVCGGGIIGERFVLTAAHCVLNRDRHLSSKNISIVAETWKLAAKNLSAKTVHVEAVFFPKEFHPTVQFSLGDIAVLRLVGTLQFKHKIEGNKLGFVNVFEIAESVTIAGFGSDGDKKDANELRMSLAKVLSSEDCAKHFPQLPSWAIDDDKHICAKTVPWHDVHDNPSPYGVCTGDAGGPLVLQEEKVIGILSKVAPDCDERQYPAIYTRVLHYVPMIFNVMHGSHDRSTVVLNT